VGDRRLEGGSEQLAGGQAAVGPSFLGDGEDLLLGREVVEPIHGLDGHAESEVARQDDALSLQRDHEGALHGPGTYAGNGGEPGHQLVIGQPAQGVLVEPVV